jgi:hypothetical protein
MASIPTRRTTATSSSSVLCNKWLAIRVAFMVAFVMLMWDRVRMIRSLHMQKEVFAPTQLVPLSKRNNKKHTKLLQSKSIQNNNTKQSVNTMTSVSSPACRPHFQVALPDGKWTNSTKFTRIYFYHVRKAGVSK